MTPAAEAQQRAAKTYNAASDSYDATALGFWSYFGQRTVEKLGLPSGSRVLDVCCGSGASAIPAARTVGPGGEVIGVDLAERILQLARQKADRAGLKNIRFETGDLLALNFPANRFDAVLCVFGIFFVPDMLAAVRELWRVLKPGGKLAITTWGTNLFEPANSVFWQTIEEARPELHKKFNPWDRITEPSDLEAMLGAAGLADLDIHTENRLHPISCPDDWWTIVLGSGYRGTVEQLTERERQKVKQANVNSVRDAKITQVQTNAVFAVATKPTP